MARSLCSKAGWQVQRLPSSLCKRAPSFQRRQWRFSQENDRFKRPPLASVNTRPYDLLVNWWDHDKTVSLQKVLKNEGNQEPNVAFWYIDRLWSAVPRSLLWSETTINEPVRAGFQLYFQRNRPRLDPSQTYLLSLLLMAPAPARPDDQANFCAMLIDVEEQRFFSNVHEQAIAETLLVDALAVPKSGASTMPRFASLPRSRTDVHRWFQKCRHLKSGRENTPRSE